MKPELQRVLESRRRDQLIKQRKEEDEARRKVSPLEAELLKRHKKLEECGQRKGRLLKTMTHVSHVMQSCDQLN
uniref:Actin-associated protein FAM107A n=1 Tax=Neolamprologus brichardi TaxID=32507 RepID=A0A3Q4GQG6_NEOBR